MDNAACKLMREWLFVINSYFTSIHFTLVRQLSKDILAQKIGHRPLTSQVRALPQGTPHGIYCVNSNTVSGFSPRTSIISINFVPQMSHSEMYNRSYSVFNLHTSKRKRMQNRFYYSWWKPVVKLASILRWGIFIMHYVNTELIQLCQYRTNSMNCCPSSVLIHCVLLLFSVGKRPGRETDGPV